MADATAACSLLTHWTKSIITAGSRHHGDMEDAHDEYPLMTEVTQRCESGESLDQIATSLLARGVAPEGVIDAIRASTGLDRATAATIVDRHLSSDARHALGDRTALLQDLLAMEEGRSDK
jgi:hypothetical protein